ncbi:MAG: RNA polymerase factor sigma-54 [Spirochaetales bacterium]|nr:RNA polymerase factor sigma-54 [Spirochaetales bacterium]MDD7271862.1 RNA polymerase factor sigma-54 [Spirochaetales bacterium]
MIESSLTLTQKQQLRLNAQMLQSLELMTLPLNELLAKIEEEAGKNPTLVVEEPNRDNGVSYEEYLDKYSRKDRYEDYSDSAAYGSDLSDNYQAWMEGAVKEEESLEEHLNKQLGTLKIDDNIKRVCEILISSLDDKGFFTTPPEELIGAKDKEYLDKALDIIHSLEPAGVGCRDFKESLICQAKEDGMKGDELKTFSLLVNDNLEKMRAGKVKEVSKALKIDEEELNELFDYLKTLTPYPGLKYSSSWDNTIIPDLSIKVEDGKLVMRLNDSTLPVVSIDSQYQQMLDEYSKSNNKEEKEASKYLKSQVNSADNLINQLALRRSTLEKVGRVLMEKQKSFFLFGPRSLKPLTLKQVADEIGVHETTVSRITTSKYIDTDWGVFQLKELFPSGIQNEDTGVSVSKTAIKDIIKEIIENNTTEKALSDQKISDMLAEKGISCARRTVNKYRKELAIDSSFIRGV